MIRTNAIMFQRANAIVGSLWEYYADADPSVVDTQATAISTNGVFSAGPFSGVYVSVANKLTNALLNNVLNDSTMKVAAPGTVTSLWGAVNDDVLSTVVQLPVTEMVLANSGNDDIDVANHNLFNVTGPTTGFSVSGFAKPIDGGAQTIILWNLTSQTMSLLNNDSGSAVGNRIITGTGGTRQVVGNGAVQFSYNGTANGWVITAIDVAGSAGTGTVTSVSVTTANGVSGSVATATSTPAITLTLGAITPTTVNSIDFTSQTTNKVLAAPSGSTGAPTFRALVAADIPQTWVAAPATAASTGTAGQMAYESGFFYICVATNTWQRVAIATW